MEKKFKVLIVDDQQYLRNILKINLEQNGFECIEAKDGQQAINLALRLMPDLILLDIMMPGISGFEVIKALKKEVSTSHIRIIVLTARATEQDRKTSYELGANNFVTKPFNITKLIDTIKIQLDCDLMLEYDENADKYSKKNEINYIEKMRNAVKNNDKEIFSELPQFLADTKYSSSVRCEAVVSIVTFRNKDMIVNLLKQYDDPDPMVREKICWALGKLEVKRAFGKLCETIKNNSETIDVKMAAAVAIKELGFENEVKPLLDAFKKNMIEEMKNRRKNKRKH